MVRTHKVLRWVLQRQSNLNKSSGAASEGATQRQLAAGPPHPCSTALAAAARNTSWLQQRSQQAWGQLGVHAGRQLRQLHAARDVEVLDPKSARPPCAHAAPVPAASTSAASATAAPAPLTASTPPADPPLHAARLASQVAGSTMVGVVARGPQVALSSPYASSHQQSQRALLSPCAMSAPTSVPMPPMPALLPTSTPSALATGSQAASRSTAACASALSLAALPWAPESATGALRMSSSSSSGSSSSMQLPAAAATPPIGLPAPFIPAHRSSVMMHGARPTTSTTQTTFSTTLPTSFNTPTTTFTTTTAAACRAAVPSRTGAPSPSSSLHPPSSSASATAATSMGGVTANGGLPATQARKIAVAALPEDLVLPPLHGPFIFNPRPAASDVTASVTATAGAVTAGSAPQWQLLNPALYKQGWVLPHASQARWGALPLAAVAIGGLSELTLLPALAPHGMCGGTAVAELAFGALGIRTDLASLLAMSEGLEAVQAFSIARKLGQIALMDAVLRGLWGGAKPPALFSMDFSLKGSLSPPYGWYWWSCVATGGLALIGLLSQGIAEGVGALLPRSMQPPGLTLHQEHHEALLLEAGPAADIIGEDMGRGLVGAGGSPNAGIRSGAAPGAPPGHVAAAVTPHADAACGSVTAACGSVTAAAHAAAPQTPPAPLLHSPGGGDPRTLPFRCRWWAESCVAAPYLEEVFFRGFLLSSLTQFMPVWGAVGVSSAAFAAAHAGAAPASELPQLMAMGVVLGLTFVRSRSLVAPFLAHAANNSVALLKETMSD